MQRHLAKAYRKEAYRKRLPALDQMYDVDAKDMLLGLEVWLRTKTNRWRIHSWKPQRVVAAPKTERAVATAQNTEANQLNREYILAGLALRADHQPHTSSSPTHSLE